MLVLGVSLEQHDCFKADRAEDVVEKKVQGYSITYFEQTYPSVIHTKHPAKPHLNCLLYGIIIIMGLKIRLFRKILKMFSI